MTITQLKAEKAQLVNKMHAAQNPHTSPNLSAEIRNSIIASNVQRYKRQIGAVQRKIDTLMGRSKVPAKRPKFAATVLPDNFAF